MIGRKALVLIVLAALALVAVPWASARADVIVGVRAPYPPRYYRYRHYRPYVVVAPAPVYVAPRPVIVAPPPVYVAPRPVVVTPAPVVVTPTPTYVQPVPVAPSAYPPSPY